MYYWKIAKIVGVEIQTELEDFGLTAKILNAKNQAESENPGRIVKIPSIENMTIFFPKVHPTLMNF